MAKKNKVSREGQIKVFKDINRRINKGVQRSQWRTAIIKAPQKWKSVRKCLSLTHYLSFSCEYINLSDVLGSSAFFFERNYQVIKRAENTVA